MPDICQNVGFGLDLELAAISWLGRVCAFGPRGAPRADIKRGAENQRLAAHALEFELVSGGTFQPVARVPIEARGERMRPIDGILE